MSSFKDANMTRLALKMKLAFHSWYNSSMVVMDADRYAILVKVNKNMSEYKNIIPSSINDIKIKVEN